MGLTCDLQTQVGLMKSGRVCPAAKMVKVFLVFLLNFQLINQTLRRGCWVIHKSLGELTDDPTGDIKAGHSCRVDVVSGDSTCTVTHCIASRIPRPSSHQGGTKTFTGAYTILGCEMSDLPDWLMEQQS